MIKKQMAFTLGQEVYTPSQTQSNNSANFDRPYSGFSAITTTWSKAQTNKLFQVDFLLGIAGLNSGAGGFQRWYHNTIQISESPLWVDELASSFHMNLYFSYTKEWKIAPAPFGILFAFTPNLALGTRDIYLEPEGIFYFGKRTNLDKSIAYNRLGFIDREMYFSFRFSYRQVIYNGLLEGNLLGDNSIFVTESKNSVVRLGIDFNNRYKRNEYKVGIRFIPPKVHWTKATNMYCLPMVLAFKIKKLIQMDELFNHKFILKRSISSSKNLKSPIYQSRQRTYCGY